MAMTIAQIKAQMTEAFLSDETIKTMYNLEDGKSFDEQFSKVSLESILFFVVAGCMWALQSLFDLHKSELNTMLDELKPHSYRWYVNKAKSFLLGLPLVQDTDEYNTSNMLDEQLQSLTIIKYASAVEKSGVVYLKIAGEKTGKRSPISADALNGFEAYMKEVKDAGVVLKVVNLPAEHFRLTLVIYYDPMVLNNQGQSFAGTYPVIDTIKSFIENLGFDGEYRNASLVDALQLTSGVVIPELQLAETSTDAITWIAVDAKVNPYSGYYRVYDDKDLNITYKAYATISD